MILKGDLLILKYIFEEVAVAKQKKLLHLYLYTIVEVFYQKTANISSGIFRTQSII